ncbi:MAG: DNA-processing protein DprA [Candidatus Paceibacterota bacterium]|jgi:DNA processing protein
MKKILLKNFPPILAPLLEIPEPPVALYIEGELPVSDKILLTVVGSRRLSTYGREVCSELIKGLAGQPIVIVSGLALGIDTVAHQSALAAHLTTLAFPGSGLDHSVLYPASNRRLAEEIIKSGGALISEYEPKFRATPYSFPRRNRLMAGLAKATLIIEANKKSGTLITARLALDYNRDVLAVPGSIHWPNSIGPNWLIKQGATPITNSDDLIEALGLENEKTGETPSLFSELELTPAENKILTLIQNGLTDRDQLIEQSDYSPAETSTALMLLTLKNLIKDNAGEITPLLLKK